MVPSYEDMQAIWTPGFCQEMNTPTTLADILGVTLSADNIQPNWPAAEYQDDSSGMALPSAAQNGEQTELDTGLLDPAMFRQGTDVINNTAPAGITAAGPAPASLAYSAPGGQPADGALQEPSSSRTVTPGPGVDQSAFPGSA